MRYLSHIFITEGLPSVKGKRKISYLTTKDEEGEIFLGTDNNPLSKETVDGMIDRGEVVPLIKKVPLQEDRSLFIDVNGEFTIADRLDVEKNVSVIGIYDPVLKKLFQE